MRCSAQLRMQVHMSKTAKVKSLQAHEVVEKTRARSLNDCLAVERTVMSNERTLLAYVRTALAILVVGVTIIKFFTSQGMTILAYSLIAGGVICLTIGFMRFTEMWHKLNVLGRCKDRPASYDEDDD